MPLNTYLPIYLFILTGVERGFTQGKIDGQKANLLLADGSQTHLFIYVSLSVTSVGLPSRFTRHFLLTSYSRLLKHITSTLRCDITKIVYYFLISHWCCLWLCYKNMFVLFIQFHLVYLLFLCK